MQARLPFVVIIFTVVLDSMGIGLILPVMPALLAELGDVTVSQAARWGGFLALSYAVMQFLMGPLLGNLSDAYGRRPVLLGSLLAMGIDYLVMASASTLWLLFVTRIVAGIAGATYSTASAYLADISKPEDRAANFGLVGASFGIGFIFGPAIGGMLGEFGTRAPFVAAALLSFANMALGLFVLKESLPPETRRPFSWRGSNPFRALLRVRHLPLIRGLVVIYLVEVTATNVYPAVWAYYTQERFGWSVGMVGLSLAAYGVCVAVVQGGLIRVILSRLREYRTALFGMSCSLVGLLTLSGLSAGWAIFALMPLLALSAVTEPALSGMASNRVGDDEQGALQGILASVGAVGTLIALPLMTQLFAGFTGPSAPVYFPGAPFFVSALMTIVGLSLLLRSRAKGTIDAP
ncbi:MAG: TCR/Tet family MFS transporter [Pseudomonadota bacterium]